MAGMADASHTSQALKYKERFRIRFFEGRALPQRYFLIAR
jgi:hypothetical protein